MTEPDPFWTEALALAGEAVGLSDPNPRVGCLLVAADGRTVIGRGHTQAAGGPHAEVMALRDAAARGFDARGATAWVTLEPCAHHGRTPPCCDALIAAGLARVKFALGDPNPLVDGRGAARLAAAGIAVEGAPPAIAEAARELNIGFIARMSRGRPWVRLKIAASLDGRTALADGRSQWITGAAARADGHAWRRRAGVVLTGSGTLRADDPRLDVRAVPTARQPLRAVLDTRLASPPGARLLDAGTGALLYAVPPDAGAADAAAFAARAAALQARGAEVVAVAAGADGRVDLAAVIADLGRRGINEVHVEAGATLNGALLDAGLVDELLVYLAPALLGDGRGMAARAPLAALPARPEFRFLSATPVGDDLRLLLRRDGG